MFIGTNNEELKDVNKWWCWHVMHVMFFSHMRKGEKNLPSAIVEQNHICFEGLDKCSWQFCYISVLLYLSLLLS